MSLIDSYRNSSRDILKNDLRFFFFGVDCVGCLRNFSKNFFRVFMINFSADFSKKFFTDSLRKSSIDFLSNSSMDFFWNLCAGSFSESFPDSFRYFFSDFLGQICAEATPRIFKSKHLKNRMLILCWKSWSVYY